MHTQQLLECIQLQLSYFEMINILWLPCSTPRLNSKILNLQNNHFGHLTSEKITFGMNNKIYRYYYDLSYTYYRVDDIQLIRQLAGNECHFHFLTLIIQSHPITDKLVE